MVSNILRPFVVFRYRTLIAALTADVPQGVFHLTTTSLGGREIDLGDIERMD